MKCKMAPNRIALKYISQSFEDCLKSSLWRGSELGIKSVIRWDQVTDLLQSFQVGNAGVAQIIARCEAKAKRRENHGDEPYDSDVNYPDIAEHEEWYPFERAARKVAVRLLVSYLSNRACNVMCCNMV